MKVLNSGLWAQRMGRVYHWVGRSYRALEEEHCRRSQLGLPLANLSKRRAKLASLLLVL